MLSDPAIIQQLNQQMLQRKQATQLVKTLPKHLEQSSSILKQARLEYDAEADLRLQSRIIWFQKKCGQGVGGGEYIDKKYGRVVQAVIRDKTIPMTHEEVGIALGISRRQAENIFNSAMRKMRAEIKGFGLETTLRELLEDESEQLGMAQNSPFDY